MNPTPRNASSYLQLLLLIFAAESIFLLPFLLARIFRPTFLDVFSITNFELGTLYSTYGIVALLSYVYGGVLADRFPPQKLMAVALFSTSLGGIYMAQYPSLLGLQIVYGYWGFSTIFLFWAAMIKATRQWGGQTKQGRAFGFLEGGRGLVAAFIGAAGVYIFSMVLPDDLAAASLAERKNSFQAVILFTSGLVAVVGGLVYFFLQENKTTTQEEAPLQRAAWKDIVNVSRLPAVRMLVLIVVCAYCGYKVTDILSLYAAKVMGFDEVNAAKVGAFQMYLRPLVCVSIGFFADRSSSAKGVVIGFLFLLAGSMVFASGQLTAAYPLLFLLNIVVIGTGVYSLRTLYFAAVKEGKIPLEVTGTAVGIISVIGYTPDIFMGPLMGYFLDHYPGISGFNFVFLLLTGFGALGLLTAIRCYRSIQK